MIDMRSLETVGYKTISCNDANQFDKFITEQLSILGWELYGTPYNVLKDGESFLAQAMIRRVHPGSWDAAKYVDESSRKYAEEIKE